MKRIVALTLVLGVIACNEDLTAPDTPIPDSHRERISHEDDHEDGQLRVMTRNVYVGADVDVVLAAQDRNQVPILVANAFQQLLATNFPERAEALAREISRARPHLVGLQEISTIRLQSPGDAVVGGTTPAETVVFDYLEILMTALAARGEDYHVVAKIQNPDVEIPMITGVDPLTFDDIRLTDFDVILARDDVEISNVVERNYAVGLPVAQLNIVIPRGYTAVTAEVGDDHYRFVNTHLEPASIPEILPIQLAQASELIATLAAEPHPVILVGDLNTHAPTGETYQLLLSEGYLDAWTLRTRRDDGFTCCHDPNLTNTTVNFDRRIDLIFLRTSASVPNVRAPIMRIVGRNPRNRTRSGLWPSDHGGVWASLKFRQAEHAEDDHDEDNDHH